MGGLQLLKECYLFHSDESGNTLMHYLVEKNDTKFLEPLVAQMRDNDFLHALSLRNRDNHTPIMMAVALSQVSILHKLLAEDRGIEKNTLKVGIDEAKQLAEGDNRLLKVFDMLGEKRKNWFSLPGVFSLSKNKSTDPDHKAQIVKNY